ncbi:MAG TPA: hypothetical protein VGL35_12000 [Rhizomicrobium sp.]|jgi:hypothetical protein
MSDTPTIRLAGRDWPVPVLAPRQNRIVVPTLLELIPKIGSARAGEPHSLAGLARYLDTAAYDQLTDIAFAALTRAHPGLSRAEFDDFPIDTLELIAAVRTIALQAGLMRGPVRE